MINFLQMKYFAMVAEERSFSAAASRLYVSQQTISAHIAQLEEEVGMPLFERTRPLTITPAGECFLRSVQNHLFINKQMEKELFDMADPTKNVLKIGVSHTYARALLPMLLQEFYTRYPQIDLQIYEMLYERMDEALAAYEVDLAITRPFYGNPNLKLIPLKMADDVFLYAPYKSLENCCGSQAADIIKEMRKQPRLELVAQCPFILPRSGTVRRGVQTMFRDAQIDPRVRVETDTLETAIFLCRNGLGITVSPGLLLQTYAVSVGGIEEYQESSYLLSEHMPEHALAICYLDKVYITDAMKKFIDLATDLEKRLDEAPGQDKS